MGVFEFDEIGYWSEVKLQIVREYGAAYSRILTKQPGLSHVYIDGFAGAGVHVQKASGQWVPGSPLNALSIQPPFSEFFLIDLDGDKVEHLKQLVGERPDAHIFKGDCNAVLLNEVFPRVLWSDYRRGLCLLDPYGLNLSWEVIAKAGQIRTIDLFLNFPIMDANRNALWRDPTRVSPQQARRLTTFWGDESWRTAAYRPAMQQSLFGTDPLEKVENNDVAEAFRKRLQDVAGFRNVPSPVAMRNNQGAVVYYLFFASQNDTANKIVADIFQKYQDRGA